LHLDDARVDVGADARHQRGPVAQNCARSAVTSALITANPSAALTRW
jgi:hypothetical protein